TAPSCSTCSSAAALPSLARADDVLARRLLRVPRAEAERRLAPRGDGMRSLVLALAAAVRVVDRVHHGAANAGPLALPPRPPGLAAGLDLVRDVAELTHGRPARILDASHLAGRQPQQGHPTLLRHQLGGA